MSRKLLGYGTRRQQGSMLVSVLFIMVIMALLMTSLATLTSQSSQQFIYEVQSLKARLAAESLLEQQVFISLDDINAEQLDDIELAGCDASLTLQRSEALVIPQQVHITATGKCSTSSLEVLRNIEVEVIDEN